MFFKNKSKSTKKDMQNIVKSINNVVENGTEAEAEALLKAVATQLGISKE